MKRRKGLRRCGTLAVVALLAMPMQRAVSQATSGAVPTFAELHCNVPAVAAPWEVKSQSAECRTVELLHAMTLDAKVRQIAHASTEADKKAYNIPDLKTDDGPNGIAIGPIPFVPPMAQGVTAFPNEIALAASWNRELAAEYGKALSEEWRAKGSMEICGPTLNLMRSWHWGRSAETFGEDPFLVGAMAVEEVKAIQAGGVSAMIKHFAANNQDWNRVGHFPDFTNIDEVIPERALEEIYFPAFHRVIAEADAAGVMCSYNQINGVPACNNAAVQGRLRQWGFTGSITPDAVFALHDARNAIAAGVDNVGPEIVGLVERHEVDEATVDAMLYHWLRPLFRHGFWDNRATGTETARVTTEAHRQLARRMIAEGTVLLKNDRETLPIDAAKTKRIVLIGAGAGKDALTGEEGPLVSVDKLNVPSEAIAARAGAAVEVKTHTVGAGIRPLATIPTDALAPENGNGHGLSAAYYKSSDCSGEAEVKRVDAVVDFHDLPAAELGKVIPSFTAPKLTWSAEWKGSLMPPITGDYVLSLHGAGTAQLKLDGKVVVDLEKVNFSGSAYGVAHLEAGKAVKLELAHSNDYSVISSVLQLGWEVPQPKAIAAAVEDAAQADVAVVFVGEQLGEGMDKMHLALPGLQNELVEAIAAKAKRTVVVVNTSTPVAMPWLGKVDAVLEGWYAGEETGAGLADVLFGDADAGGRLPVTFPRDETQGAQKKAIEYPGVDGRAFYDEGVLTGYRWYDVKGEEPLFPFGYGLSYTSFKLSDLAVKEEGDAISVTVTATNTGKRAGEEVVEAYIEAPKDADEAPSQLKGFEKLSLKPGESRTLTMRIAKQDLRSWSEKEHGWQLVDGEYVVKVGESSRALPLQQSIALKK